MASPSGGGFNFKANHNFDNDKPVVVEYDDKKPVTAPPKKDTKSRLESLSKRYGATPRSKKYSPSGNFKFDDSPKVIQSEIPSTVKDNKELLPEKMPMTVRKTPPPMRKTRNDRQSIVPKL